MAVNVNDITLISITAVGANVFTRSIENDALKANLRIVEIVGGLLIVQLAKKSNTKAAGGGVMVGALMGFIDDLFKTVTFTTGQRYQYQTANNPSTDANTDFRINEEGKEILVINKSVLDI